MGLIQVQAWVVLPFVEETCVVGVVGGVITIGVDGGIMELDPAGDRLLLDIFGFADDLCVDRPLISLHREDCVLVMPRSESLGVASKRRSLAATAFFSRPVLYRAPPCSSPCPPASRPPAG